jgi:uncharacterized membrane protein YhaH (DUF805 family)
LHSRHGTSRLREEVHQMSFGDAVRSVYAKYARFEGRAPRSEYWWYQLFLVLVVLGWVLGVGLLAALRLSPVAGILGIALLVFYVASIVPGLAVIARRLHDSDHSGWWFLISFVPYIGVFILLIFLVLPSTPGYNRYGPPVGASADYTSVEYFAWSRADALRQFSDDAQRASASGYQPVFQEWRPRGNGEVLVVTYQRGYGYNQWQQPFGYYGSGHGPSGGLG